MKKLIFRADGNTKTGLGHLYRIFALVEMCKDHFECVLLTRESSTKEIIPASYSYQTIPDAISIDEEPKWLSERFDERDYLLIADGYQFTSVYQQRLKKLNYTLVYIDDLMPGHLYADLIINHSPSAKAGEYEAEAYTKLALGTSYALVRPLFMLAARRERTVKSLDTMFVCFGGSDQFNFTFSVCKVLVTLAQVKKINIVVGEAFQSAEIYDLAKQYPHLHIYKNLSEPKLLEVMEECDMAIVPTSTILFELSCVKMPIISGYYVDNQQKAYEAFLNEKAIVGVGNFHDMTEQDLKDKIHQVLNSDPEPMLKKQAHLFDGLQQQRLTNLLNALS